MDWSARGVVGAVSGHDLRPASGSAARQDEPHAGSGGSAWLNAEPFFLRRPTWPTFRISASQAEATPRADQVLVAQLPSQSAAGRRYGRAIDHPFRMTFGSAAPVGGCLRKTFARSGRMSARSFVS